MIHALTFAAFTVTLDGKPVLPHARAAVVDGRVLLPVRSLGNALGADVGYDGPAHTITVQRDAHVATIPARGAVRIVNGHAYAPLRAVASAFGLGVGYDARTRTVALAERAAQMPTVYEKAVTPPPAAAPSYTIIENPRDGAQVHEPYPAISARFAGAAGIDPRSLRVLLDGADVTANAAVIGDQVLLTPRTALAPGSHSVTVIGRDTGNGAPVERTWSFGDSFAFTAAPAPTPFPISAIWIDRWIVPGVNAFDVYVEGAPGVTGYVGVDGVGGFFPLRVYSNNAYVAHVVVPNGVNQPFARVAARLTLPNGQQQFIILPQRINLVTPPIALPAATPVPTAVPVPRTVPTRRSVGVPTPSPSPASAQSGAVTPSPTPRPVRRSVLTATPTPLPAATRTPVAAPAHTPDTAPTPAPSVSPSPERTRRPLIRRTPPPTPAPVQPPG